jgi:hypothetical protein
MRSGVVDKYPSHCLRGNAKEVCAILPFHRALVDELDERFIDERGRLQGVVGTFFPQVARRQFPQLAMDFGHQPVQGLLLAVAPFLQ